MPSGEEVERETAQSERGVGGGKADKWHGAGDYYYEITDEGIKVTGGNKAKTLTGGKSTTLSWNDTDPKTMRMIHAILASRTDKESEMGSTYGAKPEAKPETVDEDPYGESPVDEDPYGESEDPTWAARRDRAARMGYDAWNPPEPTPSIADVPSEPLPEEDPDLPPVQPESDEANSPNLRFARQMAREEQMRAAVESGDPKLQRIAAANLALLEHGSGETFDPEYDLPSPGEDTRGQAEKGADQRAFTEDWLKHRADAPIRLSSIDESAYLSNMRSGPEGEKIAPEAFKTEEEIEELRMEREDPEAYDRAKRIEQLMLERGYTWD